MKLDDKTNLELNKMIEDICNDPNNKESGGIYLYTVKARKKLDSLYCQITHNLATKRAMEGNPVISDGYSGRKSNKR